MDSFLDNSLTLHTDLYQINMIKTYWEKNIHNNQAVFEAFFRKMPFKNGYAVFVGLERIIEYLNNLHFTESDIDYLRKTQKYREEFLEYLLSFEFSGTIRSVEEGDLVFNNEPIFQIEGSLVECQLIETAILNIINFQTVIATKASRIRSIIGSDLLLEFGSRRAQEVDAALWGARASYIGGCDGTSNVRAGKKFNIPVSGTHAHSLVQYYMNDYDAFKSYAETHYDCVFLVDTFDTLKSGVPNAIKVAQEMGDKINFIGVRIDSGDMSFISKRIRMELDKAGFYDAKIFASNDLDEETIQNLKMQHAKIDAWGVGTKLITAYDQPTLGAVYKMVAVERDGEMVDTIKLSNNAEKVSTPGKKQVWRINNQNDGKSEGDYITLWDEKPQECEGLYMFHPEHIYINKTVTNFKARPLLKEIFNKGKLTYKLPNLNEIKENAQKQLDDLWDEYKRILNPEEYPVDLSQKCYDRKMKVIHDVQAYVQKLKF